MQIEFHSKTRRSIVLASKRHLCTPEWYCTPLHWRVLRDGATNRMLQSQKMFIQHEVYQTSGSWWQCLMTLTRVQGLISIRPHQVCHSDPRVRLKLLSWSSTQQTSSFVGCMVVFVHLRGWNRFPQFFHFKVWPPGTGIPIQVLPPSFSS